MTVKAENDEAVTIARPKGKRPAKSDFWVTREELLRGYLERGMDLRQAAEAIGASYSATEAKARRLGIWPRQKADTEAASASEWVLAGYGGEDGFTASGGLEVAPDAPIHPDLTKPPKLRDHPDPAPALKRALKRSTRLVTEGQPAEPKPKRVRGYRGFESKAAYEAHYSDERNYADEIPAMEAYAKEPKPIAADSPDEEEPAGAGTECWFCTICRTMTLLAKAEAGECCVEPRRKDCPTRLMVPPDEQGEIDTDQIPLKPKREATRSKPPKPVFSAPIAQLEVEAPKKREWDFPPPGGCLFPFGDVGRPGFSFCSEPVAGVGIPYCREHVQRVYGRGVIKEEAG